MIHFTEGELVLVNGKECVIKRVATFDTIHVQSLEDSIIRKVQRADIHPPIIQRTKMHYEELTEKQRETRDLKFELVKPLVNRRCSRTQIKAVADKAVEMGLVKKGDLSTIYDWKRRIERSGNRNSLAPPISPSGGRGKQRLLQEAEDLLGAVVEEEFLTSQKKLPTAVVSDVQQAFWAENKRRLKEGRPLLRQPCKATIIARIKALDPIIAEERRYGKKAAKERFGIMKGHLECGRWPWELGQMDHKLLRTVAIDDVTGEPLGNPWLTAIIDTNSRVPPGFILSLAKPAGVTIGLCLAMSMIQKGYWLKKWGIDQEEFPIFGRWGTVQVDNELKNESIGIVEGCKKRNIELEFRPLRSPQSGGFIESFFRTIDIELKNLPGYKSKIRKSRENYDAEENATFTLPRLSQAIAVIIIKIYCNRMHSGLGDTPLNVYKRNLITSGIGIPDMMLEDEARNLVLDFMPYENRTIQEYGVQLFGTCYRSDVLGKYMKIGKEVR